MLFRSSIRAAAVLIRGLVGRGCWRMGKRGLHTSFLHAVMSSVWIRIPTYIAHSGYPRHNSIHVPSIQVLMTLKYNVSIHGAAYGQQERMQEEGRKEKVRSMSFGAEGRESGSARTTLWFSLQSLVIPCLLHLLSTSCMLKKFYTLLIIPAKMDQLMFSSKEGSPS